MTYMITALLTTSNNPYNLIFTIRSHGISLILIIEL